MLHGTTREDMAMETRTILLAVHIAMAAGWLGADLVQYVLAPRFAREGHEVQTAWARQLVWMHERYYAAVAALLLASGVLLVLDGDWSWGSDFIWVGVGAIVGGATLGGGVLGNLSKKRLAALEGGDAAEAAEAERRYLPIALVVTVLPLLAILAMVDKWSL